MGVTTLPIEDILASLGKDAREGEEAGLLNGFEGGPGRVKMAREVFEEGLIIEGRELLREAQQGMDRDGFRGKGSSSGSACN